MGIPYLKSGESIILTTDRVAVDSIPYDAMLTSQSLILIESRNSRAEPRIFSLSAVRSVRSGKAATGEPVILLALEANEAEETRKIILFSQQAGENRKPDRDTWLQKLIELSVSGQGEIAGKDTAPAQVSEGIRPATRRWLAPDVIRPHAGNMPEKEPVPALVISIDEQVPEPAPMISGEMPTVAESPENPEPRREGIEPDTELSESPKVSSSHEDFPQIPPVSPPGTAVSEVPGSLTSSILVAVKSLTEKTIHDEVKSASIRLTTPLPEIRDVPPGVRPDDDVVVQVPPIPPETSGYEVIPVTVRTRSLLPEISARQPEPEAPVSIPPVVPEPVSSGPVHEPEQKLEIPAPAPEKKVAVKEKRRENIPPPPAPTPSNDRSILIASGAILCILLVVIGFTFLQGSPDQERGPVTAVPTNMPVVTTVAAPSPAPVPVPLEGVWVRIVSPGYFTGQAGSVGYLQQISGSGDKIYKMLYHDSIVSVTVEKKENTGDELLVEIYRDGMKIASRSTTKPMGNVDMLIDPATGKEPGMATHPTAVPTIKQIENY